jgi:4-carboxymuconolactone decarboxylase
VEHPDRLRPLALEEMSEAARSLLAVTVERMADSETAAGGAVRTEPLPILAVMAHHPTFLGPFVEWATAVAQRGLITKREQEILALRVALNCRSEFEWGHHVVFGRSTGMTDDDLDRIVAGPDAPGWSPAERALVRAADELGGPACDLSEATWTALRTHYDDARLAEIPFVVGQYTMLSMFANALGVALEDGYEPLPADGRRRPPG